MGLGLGSRLEPYDPHKKLATRLIIMTPLRFPLKVTPAACRCSLNSKDLVRLVIAPIRRECGRRNTDVISIAIKGVRIHFRPSHGSCESVSDVVGCWKSRRIAVLHFKNTIELEDCPVGFRETLTSTRPLPFPSNRATVFCYRSHTLFWP